MATELVFEHVLIDEQGPANPHTKAVGDVNGDGLTDLLVASSAGGPLVWYEYPSWRRHVIAPSGKWSTDAKLVDMDGDGDLDVVISDWYAHDRMEWYENPLPDGDPAAGPWELHVIGKPRAHDFQVADIDGDGRLEIITRQQGGQGDELVLWKRTDGEQWASRTIPCPRGEGLAVGGLSGVEGPVVVIGGRWYEPPDDVMADAWAEHAFAKWPPDAVVKLADMNGDGWSDIVMVRSEGPHRLSWFEAPADPRTGPWPEHVIDDSVDFAHSLAVADMDADGLPDVVTAEMHQSERRRVLVYRNRGGADSWHRQVLATTGSHNLCVADFGKAGRPGLAGANWSGPYQPVEAWLQRPESAD